MKLYVFSVLLALLVLSATAALPKKQVVITYPSDTPDSVLDEAKLAITSAGGIITHEYELIKGFAVKASVKILDKVHALSADFRPTIEEDSIVTELS
ncbi:hypothetical protein MMC34_007297 [Xylographa carneopallida]|nr:hypothetical protein [Xylographa carneopallida]